MKVEDIKLAFQNNQKFELSLISELIQNINKGVATGDKAKTQINIVDNLYKQRGELKLKLEKTEKDVLNESSILKDLSDDTNSYLSRASIDYSTLVNKASDLGIEYPKNIDTNYKILEKQVEYLKNSIPKTLK